jgi:hypothetical protein
MWEKSVINNTILMAIIDFFLHELCLLQLPLDPSVKNLHLLSSLFKNRILLHAQFINLFHRHNNIIINSFPPHQGLDGRLA